MEEFVCHTLIQAFAAKGLNRWPECPERPLNYALVGGIGRVSEADVKAIIPHGLAKITRHVPRLTFQYTTNHKTAQIVYRAAKMGEGGMGRPGDVLADAMLVPPGLQTNDEFQSPVRFDPAESWTTVEDATSGGVTMQDVFGHETVHVLGLGHSDDPKCLMHWKVVRGVHEFRGWTVDQLTMRYPGEATRPAPSSGHAKFTLPGGATVFLPEPFTAEGYVFTKRR